MYITIINITTKVNYFTFTKINYTVVTVVIVQLCTQSFNIYMYIYVETLCAYI